MKGITFNSKHSFIDFNLILNSKRIGMPAKKKIKEAIPGMNSSYDFSTVASGGEIIYNQRSIEVKFTLISNSKIRLHSEINKISEWIEDIGQNHLIFDDIPDYYFLAEIEEGIDIIESNTIAEITVNFIAEPFKIGIDYSVNNIWDTFNFEEDYLQNDEFEVDGTPIIIYNPGRLVVPTFTVDASIALTINSYTLNLTVGTTTDYKFKLQNGENIIETSGLGNLQISFRKVNL